MKALTINELCDLCLLQKMNGNGNKVVVISSDDECNEYHHLWEGFVDGKEVAGDIDPYQMVHCTSQNAEDYVFLL